MAKNGSIPSRNKKEKAFWKGVTDKHTDKQTESIVDNNDSYLGAETKRTYSNSMMQK